MFDEWIAQLNAPDSWDRLDALKALMQKIQDGEMEAPKQLNSVNNHIHTTYSFSPYSPTKAVWTVSYTHLVRPHHRAGEGKLLQGRFYAYLPGHGHHPRV